MSEFFRAGCVADSLAARLDLNRNLSFGGINYFGFSQGFFLLKDSVYQNGRETVKDSPGAWHTYIKSVG